MSRTPWPCKDRRRLLEEVSSLPGSILHPARGRNNNRNNNRCTVLLFWLL